MIQKTVALLGDALKQQCQDSVVRSLFAVMYTTSIVLISLTLDMTGLVRDAGQPGESYETASEGTLRYCFMSVFMMVGVCLCAKQLRDIRIEDRMRTASFKRKVSTFAAKHGLMVSRHLLLLLCFLVVLCSLCLVLAIVQDAFMVTCFGTHLSSGRMLKYAPECLYHAMMIVFVLVQAAWCYKTRYNLAAKEENINGYGASMIYNKKNGHGGLLYSWSVCHCVATNVALYLNTALHEAKHTFEIVESGIGSKLARSNNSADHEGHALLHCSHGSPPSSTMISYSELYKTYLESIGYAMSTETLVVLTMTLWSLANVKQEVTKKLQRTQPRLSLTPTPELEVDNPKGQTFRLKLDQVAKTIVCTLMAVIALGLSVHYIAEFLPSIKHMKSKATATVATRRPQHHVLIETMEYGLLATVTLISWWDQIFAVSCALTEGAKISVHAKLDVLLLQVSSFGRFVLLIVEVQSAISLWTLEQVSTATEVLDIIHLLFVVLQVVSQVAFLARAVSYNTYQLNRIATEQMVRKSWILEIVCSVALLLFNATRYLMNLFTRKDASFLIANNYYPRIMWAALHELCYPLVIFFRFHSFVILFSLVVEHIKSIKLVKIRNESVPELLGLMDRNFNPTTQYF